MFWTSDGGTLPVCMEIYSVNVSLWSETGRGESEDLVQGYVILMNVLMSVYLLLVRSPTLYCRICT